LAQLAILNIEIVLIQGGSALAQIHYVSERMIYFG
jgi:hypothetical protein